MRKTSRILGVALLLVGPAAPAAIKGKRAAPAPAAQSTRFDDVEVQGKYQGSQEPVTTVENDKAMDALLAPPADFKDRLKRSAAQDQ